MKEHKHYWAMADDKLTRKCECGAIQARDIWVAGFAARIGKPLLGYTSWREATKEEIDETVHDKLHKLMGVAVSDQ